MDFLHEDHLREREICATLDALAAAAIPQPDRARAALAFPLTELPLHLRDEEADLFPLLRRRCAPEDEIGKAIARLSSDHRHAGDETPEVVAILETLLREARAPSAEEGAVLTRFAGYARRHLILENAIILPLARLRLTPDDLETLRLNMMRRRGLDRVTETSNAERPA